MPDDTDGDLLTNSRLGQGPRCRIFNAWRLYERGSGLTMGIRTVHEDRPGGGRLCRARTQITGGETTLMHAHSLSTLSSYFRSTQHCSGADADGAGEASRAFHPRWPSPNTPEAGPSCLLCDASHSQTSSRRLPMRGPWEQFREAPLAGEGRRTRA